MKKKILSILGLIIVVFSLVLVGCSSNTSQENGNLDVAQSEALSDSGILILKVNPEIAIKYNADGVVTEIIGRNDDGKQIVDTYSDYIGKDSGLVLEELIKLIGEAGYFVEEVEGEAKQIIIEIEPGSILPAEDFLERMTVNIQKAVSEMNVDSDIVSNNGLLTLEAAKDIALKDANVKLEDAKFDDKELDNDDTVLIWELEFKANGYEYEYDIDALTGEILKKERDKDSDKAENKKDDSPYDDTNYDDTNYDDSNDDNTNYDDSGYDDSAYGSKNTQSAQPVQPAKPAATKPVQQAQPAAPAKKPVAQPQKPATTTPKPAAPVAKPATPAAPKSYDDSDYSDYDDSGYDDSGYDDSGYDDSGYDDSDYDDSDYN